MENQLLELSVLFAQAANRYRVSIDRVFAPLNLNGGQVAVLMSLWRADGQTQAELARDLCVSAPTVSKMLQTMTARGFVTSVRCPHDSRSVRIHLTAGALALRGAVERGWAEAGRAHFGSFTETEQLILLQLLAKTGPAQSSGTNRGSLPSASQT